ncbi:helix-turn-helix transcriptional regulator [Oceanobacillus arenosus]|nr:helix-turn-helix transcriptional regulator [Oceanobacillus arenosus]
MNRSRMFKVMGENIRNHRMKQLQTIEELAEKANLDDKNLGEIERGKGFHISTCYQISRALGITVEDIFAGVDEVLTTDDE